MSPELFDLKSILNTSINNASKVFIIGHKEPDYDAIGAAIGVSLLAKKQGKPSYIIVDDIDTMLDPGVKKIIDDNRKAYNIINREQCLSLVDSNSILSSKLS